MREIEIPEGYEARIEGNKVIMVPKESEDERIRNAIGLILIATEEDQDAFYRTHNLTRKECTAWLEKQKEQKSAEWSEEDEEMLDSTIKFVEHSAFSTIGKGKNNVLDWLKDLPNRFAIQPKQEWSEEEEEKKKRIILLVEHAIQEMGGSKKYKEALDWLKSLRPHPHWKPSKVQMEVLGRAITFLAMHNEEFRKTGHNNGLINDLYKDLQKLM